MIDRKRLVKQSEQDLSDYLKLRPQEISQGIDETNARIAGTRAQYGKTAGDVSRETVGALGLPDTGAAGASVGRISEGLDIENANAMSLRRLQQTQDVVNKTANFLYSRLINAGVDEKSARLNAIQYALDEQRRQIASAENVKGREHAAEMNTIQAQIRKEQVDAAQRFAENQRKRAIYNSMIKSFFGLAATLGTAGALKGASTAAKVGTTAAVGAAGTAASEFEPQDVMGV